MPVVIMYITGVYEWVNGFNGKVYVGGAYRSLNDRKATHIRDLKRGSHFNKHLQAAWNKYGESMFVFSILERCSADMVKVRETWWIAQRDATNPEKGYNKQPIAGSALGQRHSKEAREKMKMTNKGKFLGRRHTQGAKDKVSAARKGKKLSPEHCAKIGDLKRGTKRSPEASEKAAAKHRGMKRSEETRANMRKAQGNLEARARMIKILADPVVKERMKAGQQAARTAKRNQFVNIVELVPPPFIDNIKIVKWEDA